MVAFIVFNATFNNISVISWQSVLLVEETGVHEENQRPVTSYWQTLSHNFAWNTPHHERDPSHNANGSNGVRVVKVVVNPTTIRSQPRQPIYCKMMMDVYCSMSNVV
jgi:hypothetical protein